MRSGILLLAAMLALAAEPTHAKTLYGAHGFAEPPFERDAALCGEGPGEGFVGYAGGRKVCADVLVQRIEEIPELAGGPVDEIVLLTSRPQTRTLYRVGEDRRPILPLGNLARPMDRPLSIRGQRGAEGGHLVWLKGLELIDTICDPDRVADFEACRAGRPSGTDEDGEQEHWSRRYEVTSLALIEEARIARGIERSLDEHRGVTGKGPRHYCVRLRRVSGVVLSDLAFEDCWLSAVVAVNARHVELRDARIHGSTSGLLAIATRGLSADSHGFVVSGTHWIQSPSAYKSDAPCAEPHLDLSCPLDLWDDIPWGVTHHHIWRPLNGGLFAAYNIAGNVLFENNVIERAFNGIRIISESPETGRNVTVRGNVFRFIRDNAVEPEGRAESWLVKHNRFENVHAWFSTDGVRGRDIYIFGNVASYDPDRMPGTACSDAIDWESSPFFEGLAGDRGRYVLLDVSYDPTSIECRGHYRGAILKTGDKRKAGFPYLDRISVFHNSWQTRSPLWGNKHASPLVHFNNLVELTGCGLDGPWHCRQIPTPPQYCGAGNKRTRGRVALEQYWTDDGGALLADCVSLRPGPAEPDDRAEVTRDIAHIFCRDLYNRRFAQPGYGEGHCGAIFESDAMIVEAATPPRLARPIAGCGIRLAADAIFPDCTVDGEPIGAVGADGTHFDTAIEDAGYLGDAFRP